MTPTKHVVPLLSQLERERQERIESDYLGGRKELPARREEIMSADWQEQLVFTNDFKSRFCNGCEALNRHAANCVACSLYLRTGDGDLCEAGKREIKTAMVLADETKSD